MIIRRNRNVFQTPIIDTEVYNCVIKVPGPVFLTLRVKILLRIWRYLILYLNFKLSTSPIMVKNSDKLIVNGSTSLLSPIIEMSQFDLNVVERKEPDEMISWNMLLVETLLFWLLLSMMSLRLMIISMRLLTPTVIIWTTSKTQWMVPLVARINYPSEELCLLISSHTNQTQAVTISEI